MIPLLSFGIVAASVPRLQTEPGTLTVHEDKPLHPMAKGFYGLMTEEINHSYDGGIYGELVQNRALQDDPARPAHWSAVEGTIEMRDEAVAGTALMRVLVLGGPGAVANDGYWGIPVRPKTTYRASLYARGDAKLTVSIESLDGKSVWASATSASTGVWRKIELRLNTEASALSAANRLVVRASGPVRLAEVSLFGPTFKNRPNGNRADLMALLGGMRPTFLRLPGGNYLEGNTVAERFDWKTTLGRVEDRKGHMAPWGYRSSDGMGLLEYLQWCEDLKMKPLLAVFAGYALRGEHIEPGPLLAPFVTDALEEIEFVTGDKGTKWGAVRAKLGHPKPFPLEYVEVGNEDWFDRSGSYDGRFAHFYDAIKAKYPRLQLIATTGVKSRRPDLLDDHYYRTAAQMASDSTHYRNADRNGPKIFVGEWASLQGQPTPDLQAALGDAAWLTGLERDSDLVVMEAYAPLFTNVNPGASQWNTNLIGYDVLGAFGSPAYWVQALFAQNQGSTVVPVDVAPAKAPEAFPFRGGVGVGSSGGGAEFQDGEVEGRSLPSFGSWTLPRNWVYGDGSLRQSVVGRPARTTAGDPSWTDLTFRIKARRTGDGTISVLFHALDDHNLWQWTLGGGTDEIRHTEIFSTRIVAKGEPVELSVGDWADLRLEVKGGHIRGFVDGKLAIEADEAPPTIPTVYASASVTGKETILKVVNLSATDTPMKLSLGGGRYATKGWCLAGPLWGQNSVAEPTRYAPHPLPEGIVKEGDVYAFAAHSVTVLRLRKA